MAATMDVIEGAKLAQLESIARQPKNVYKDLRRAIEGDTFYATGVLKGPQGGKALMARIRDAHSVTPNKMWHYSRLQVAAQERGLPYNSVKAEQLVQSINEQDMSELRQTRQRSLSRRVDAQEEQLVQVNAEVEKLRLELEVGQEAQKQQQLTFGSLEDEVLEMVEQVLGMTPSELKRSGIELESVPHAVSTYTEKLEQEKEELKEQLAKYEQVFATTTALKPVSKRTKIRIAKREKQKVQKSFSVQDYVSTYLTEEGYDKENKLDWPGLDALTLKVEQALEESDVQPPDDFITLKRMVAAYFDQDPDEMEPEPEESSDEEYECEEEGCSETATDGLCFGALSMTFCPHHYEQNKKLLSAKPESQESEESSDEESSDLEDCMIRCERCKVKASMDGRHVTGVGVGPDARFCEHCQPNAWV